MTVRLSCTTKLDGIRSWSLPAVRSCPGAHDKDGNLVPVCQGCYATTGNYNFPNVREPREHNLQDWKRDGWVEEMVAVLNNDRYFRWFDSGDIHHPKLGEKIYQVILHTPWCNHWLPTRSHKLPRIAPIITWIEELPNACVRRSSDEVDGSFDSQIHGSCVIPNRDNPPPGVHVCPAYTNPGNKCNGCRACWNKEVSVVAYVAHGVKMNRVLKRELISETEED